MNLLFRALDDPTRRRILDLLGGGDRTAGELAAAFDLGKPTISHHLGLLRQAGLVSSRKEGQSVRYRLESTVLAECLGWFMQLIERGKHHPTDNPHENPKPAAKGMAATPPAGVTLRARGRVVG